MSDNITLLSPGGMLGYGIPEGSLRAAVEAKPDFVAIDAGSVDPGPYYLGAGEPFVSRESTLRDLTAILQVVDELHVPFVIGSAGGAGAAAHVATTIEIMSEALNTLGKTMDVAVIHSDIAPERMEEFAKAGRVTPLEHDAEWTTGEAKSSNNIVAQMGVEPIVEALATGAQVVLAGRALDSAIFAAPLVSRGYDRGVAYHVGKILECGAMAAEPKKGSDALLAFVDTTSFTLEPPSREKYCTVQSVAGHALYERSSAFSEDLPGGTLDLRDVQYEQLNGRQVRVTGSRFVPSDQYRVKVEGAALVGYRTVSIAGVRDPGLLAQLDEFFDFVRQRVFDDFPHLVSGRDYHLLFRVYGRDGVMGPLEPTPVVGHEVGLVIEVVAETPELSKALLGHVRAVALHGNYPGRKAVSGNLAFPFSPSDVFVGPAYRFSLHHLLELDDPLELFPMTRQTLGGVAA